MRNFGSTARNLVAGAAALVCLTAPAAAEEFSWSATGTVTSDYIFRGQSLSGEDPVFQASIDGSYGILYFGTWGTSLADEGQVELDFYAGINPKLGPVTFDLGVVYYAYFWDNPSDSNYVEFKLGAEFSPITNLTLTPVLWWAPDQENYPDTYAVEGTIAYELPAVGIFTPTVSGLLGYTESDEVGFFGNSDEYTYWNAGVALAVEKFTFDFRYWDTDLADPNDPSSDERFVFTASVTLP